MNGEIEVRYSEAGRDGSGNKVVVCRVQEDNTGT
jgi:hypothetical protein